MVPASSSLSGRVCVVTGATSGVGEVAARELARRGARVVLVARNPARAAATLASIQRVAPESDCTVLFADLSSSADVEKLAGELLSRFPAIHVLVNNAGAIFARRETTAEGRERTWALNVLAPFLLTYRLAERMVTSAPARVANVASEAHRGARLDPSAPMNSGRYSAWRSYSRSKLALVVLTREFARRYAGTGVTVNAVHPGFVATRFGRNNPGLFGAGLHALEFLFGIRPERGGERILALAGAPDLAHVSGAYFLRGRASRPSQAALDPATAASLWTACCRTVAVPVDLRLGSGAGSPSTPS